MRSCERYFVLGLAMVLLLVYTLAPIPPSYAATGTYMTAPAPCATPPVASLSDAPSSDANLDSSLADSTPSDADLDSSLADSTPSDTGPDSSLADSTPSDADLNSSLTVRAGAVASSSDAEKQIWFLDSLSVVAVDAGQLNEQTCLDFLPDSIIAMGDFENPTWLSCGLEWHVSQIDWNRPGLYFCRAIAIPPEGYTFTENVNPVLPAVVSVRRPGTYQVIDVFSGLGHTWSVSMPVGGDISPLVEALQDLGQYRGIMDIPGESIFFDVTWDFSSVDTQTPGIYPVRRALKVSEDWLPEGVDGDQIVIPEYWKNLTLLLSVEEPGKPQLYGVIDNPETFIGSWLPLTQRQLDELSVYYSVDGGDWTLQTDEGYFKAMEKSYNIYKKQMEEGRTYAFCVELDGHVSQILKVSKKEMYPVWFIWSATGNRDGTIDVQFPSVSQPPPGGNTGTDGDDGDAQDSGKAENIGGNVPALEAADQAAEAVDANLDPSPALEEIVTEDTTRISGMRAAKLTKLNPEWITFQKEAVLILLSSQWLRDLKLADDDMLTVRIQEEDDEVDVEILVNEEVPKDTPVYQIESVGSGRTKAAGIPGALAGLILTLALACLLGLCIYLRRKRE